MSRFRKRAILVLIVMGVAVAAFWYLRRPGSEQGTSLRTVPVKRGDLVVTISATGTVEPEEVVDVGAQVAGMILTFGKDKQGKAIDYGSVVEEGTVLAQIDDSLYAADVAQAKAQLEQARAGVRRAEADLGQLRARLLQAERDWARAQKLGPSEALSQSDFDAAQSAYEVAKANVGVGEAAIVQAKDSVAQADAGLQRAQRNLGYCTIKSPVKGVIIDRRVNIGQTVVASLNAPSLFLIAKDLKRMQVWVAVNEADIGNIRPDQPVTFTVDAYPGQVFQGKVGKVRLNATMTQNVVTYTVEVNTDNSNSMLLPYLTANVKFGVNERRNVLLVPNAALRWTPRPEQVAEGWASEKASHSGSPAREDHTRGVLWTHEGDFVRPIPVQVGTSDGATMEVQGDELSEGTQVVVGEQPKEAGSPSSAKSPFTPQMRGGGGAPARR
jgi:HlyD family secretion protein